MLITPPLPLTLTSGKVRDQYRYPSSIVLLTTDRQSGFDRSLCSVPFKGSVLNQISNFWFKKTEHIIPNHVVSLPHPNVTIGLPCKPFAVEMVVRAYVTGSTSTSIWKNYQSGVRNYCGIDLPEGLTKNEKLWDVLFTPTTKDEHDRPISCEDIGEIRRGAKRLADNVSVENKSHAHLHFYTRRASSLIVAIVLIPHPNLFRDSLRSSQSRRD
jgi:phosphoribosylaminoimidazole-succinocarboxamide synthase